MKLLRAFKLLKMLEKVKRPRDNILTFTTADIGTERIIFMLFSFLMVTHTMGCFWMYADDSVINSGSNTTYQATVNRSWI